VVSLVIILFLVAVLVTLFLGRIAEILLGRMQDRASQRKAEDKPGTAAHRVVSRKIG
jgi:hypothetical protein